MKLPLCKKNVIIIKNKNRYCIAPFSIVALPPRKTCYIEHEAYLSQGEKLKRLYIRLSIIEGLYFRKSLLKPIGFKFRSNVLTILR